MKKTAIIVDDERLARNELKKMLTDYPEIEKKIKELDSFFGKDLVVIHDKDLVNK